MRSRSLLTVSVPVLCAGLGLTACSSGSTASPPKTAAVAPVSVVPVAGQSGAPAAAPSAAPSTGAVTTARSSDSSQAPKCSTQDLRWTLTRLTDAGTGTGAKDPANAELVAVNAGTRSCTLTGYPKLEFHLGKGPQATGVGTGSPAPVALGAGTKVVIALRYSEFNGKGPDSGNCVFVTAGAAEVAAPGDGSGVRVPVVDRSGKPAEITICGNEVRMSPPVTR